MWTVSLLISSGVFFGSFFVSIKYLNILETHSAKVFSFSCFPITPCTVLRLFLPTVDRAMGWSWSAAMIYPESNRGGSMEITRLTKLYVRVLTRFSEPPKGMSESFLFSSKSSRLNIEYGNLGAPNKMIRQKL